MQTLSRLNRAHPKKHDVFVLDFQNDVETIQKSFADYYRTTIFSKETDPNKHAAGGRYFTVKGADAVTFSHSTSSFPLYMRG